MRKKNENKIKKKKKIKLRCFYVCIGKLEKYFKIN